MIGGVAETGTVSVMRRFRPARQIRKNGKLLPQSGPIMRFIWLDSAPPLFYGRHIFADGME